MQMGSKSRAAGPGWNEEIADSRKDPDEPLQVPGRSKALHHPLSSTERQMRVLRPVIQMGYSACCRSPPFRSEVRRFRLMVQREL
jgi:hypothetical protein